MALKNQKNIFLLTMIEHNDSLDSNMNNNAQL